MKRLLLFPLVLVLTSCGYGSLYEARDACSEGTGYDRCLEEDESKQVLGIRNGKVIKRFPY